MDKRFQVFVSSTFVDLVEERDCTIKAILELQMHPAGMELFPAADDDQMRYIKRIIDESDYYVLILAARYGTVSRVSGLGYTEMEFDYAVARGIPILAFIHEDPDSISNRFHETTQKGRNLLEKFRAKAKGGRVVKFWQNTDQLGALISRSLSLQAKSNPQRGWIRSPQDEKSTQAFSPIHAFEPVNGNNPSFNSDLSDELDSTKHYFFRGVSGKRVPVRVRRHRNPADLKTRLLLVHPHISKKFLNDRLLHRMSARQEFDVDAETSRISSDVYLSLAGLFQTRLYCKEIRISFQALPTIQRLEFTDNASYLSVYDGRLSERKYNPYILKYDSQCIIFDHLSAEAIREYEASASNGEIVLDPSTPLHEFSEMMQNTGLKGFTQESLDDYSNQFYEFESNFSKVFDVVD